MTPVIKEQFDRLTTDAYLLEGYGITECAPIIAANPKEKQKLNSVGRVIPGVECRIMNLDTGKVCKTGEAGMIYVRGNNVFHGYLGDEVANPFEEIEGQVFYKTGDLGYLDDEGYLFITGRLKRFIKIAGEMISLPFIVVRMGSWGCLEPLCLGRCSDSLPQSSTGSVGKPAI